MNRIVNFRDETVRVFGGSYYLITFRKYLLVSAKIGHIHMSYPCKYYLDSILKFRTDVKSSILPYLSQVFYRYTCLSTIYM